MSILVQPEIKPDQISVNTFIKKSERGEISFDNPYQRGYVWNALKASRYIHSILCGIAHYQ